MKIENTAGKRFYGLHFYPGVAEYQEPDGEPYRVFLNENTLRSMDQSFEGKPVFVEHVDDVEPSIDELRKEADGWVVRSFYNAVDGKHWVEFLICSERGIRAVSSGMKLSNAYLPKAKDNPGLWNGVQYSKEVIGGEYEHLAIVKNPRYEESIIMTPEEFKAYNDNHSIELKRLANSNDKKGEEKVKLNFFKREKIANSVDLESTVVELPKSKKEMTISELVTEMDIVKNMQGYASDDHMVKVGENEMSVKDLVKKHMDACNELAEMKKPKENEGDEDMPEDMENAEDEATTVAEGMKDVGSRGGDKSLDNAEDEKEEEKKKNAIEKAKRLKNAVPREFVESTVKIETSMDKVARGKSLFGK